MAAVTTSQTKIWNQDQSLLWVLCKVTRLTKTVTSQTENPDHPAFYCNTMFLSLAHWNYHTPYDFFQKQMMNSDFKYGNSHQPTIKGVLTIGTNNEYCGNDHLILSSSQPVFAINPGSHVALYHDEHCIGGALVLRPGASQYALNYRKYRPKQPTGLQKAIAQIWSKLFFQWNYQFHFYLSAHLLDLGSTEFPYQGQKQSIFESVI